MVFSLSRKFTKHWSSKRIIPTFIFVFFNMNSLISSNRFSFLHISPIPEKYFDNFKTGMLASPVMKETSSHPRNPYPTVDSIIEVKGGVVLIERKNPPHGWALPGGFVEWGESLEDAAIREAKEETSLAISLLRQFHTYSDPNRDPRHHTITTVYIARADGDPVASGDAKSVGVFFKKNLPHPLCFDHADILCDYFSKKYQR